MQKRPAVIDSSCVIAIDAIDSLPLLSLLFSELWIPRAVRDDLFRRRMTKDRIKAALKTYAFVQPCNEYDQAAVDVLQIERR